MKSIQNYMDESLLSIYEVSSDLMKRAAQAQKDKLNDDEYLNTISAKKYNQLKDRVETFRQYAEKKYKDELKFTDKRLKIWLDKHSELSPQIEERFKINKNDKLQGYAHDWVGRDDLPDINLSTVTEIIIISENVSKVDNDRHYFICYDCNGKFGVTEWLEKFFIKIGKKEYTIENLNLLKEIYEWCLNNIDNDDLVKNLKLSNVEDIINDFDDKNLGNKNGYIRIDTKTLYKLLRISGCYFGSNKQKSKNGKQSTYEYWRNWGYAVRDILDLTANDGLSDFKDKIEYEYENFDNIKDINITNVKDSRNENAFKNSLVDCAMLYLCDKILKNNVSKAQDQRDWYGGDRSKNDFISITSKDELTYDDLKDWMKTFGLTQDKVHITGKTIKIIRKDFI